MRLNRAECCSVSQPSASSCPSSSLLEQSGSLPLWLSCTQLCEIAFHLRSCESRQSSAQSATLLCKVWVHGSLPLHEAWCFHHIHPDKSLFCEPGQNHIERNTKIYKLKFQVSLPKLILTTSHWDTSHVLVTQGPAWQYPSE